MEPEFQTIPEKKIIGQKMTMSLAENRTRDLWQNFMPSKNKIQYTLNQNLFSIEVYSPHFFQNFSPSNTFEKWAGMEVSSFDFIPEGMESIILPEGLYAVFHYIGPASKGHEAFQYIFQTWLPSSGYHLDDRPHFEIMDDRYKNDDPHSEEMFYIPVKPKA